MDRGALQAMGPWDHKASDMTEVTEHRNTSGTGYYYESLI